MHTHTRSLKSLIRLDRKIYRQLKQIVWASPETPEESAQMYLQGSNQTAYSMLTSSANALDHAIVAKLAGNPLAAHGILWRVVNFVRAWAMDTHSQKSKLYMQYK